MRWIEIENPLNKKMARWMRSAAIDDSGTVFAPAAISGNEEVAVLSASWDGTNIVFYHDHAFISTDWLANEYPKTKEVCEKISDKVREVAGQNATVKSLPTQKLPTVGVLLDALQGVDRNTEIALRFLPVEGGHRGADATDVPFSVDLVDDDNEHVVVVYLTEQ